MHGSALELWPTISYGNPGNASVLNRLLNDDDAAAKFIADAIAIAHKQKLTGFNWDLEAVGQVSTATAATRLPSKADRCQQPAVDSAKLGPFLQKFGAALHAATPVIGISYDAGNSPIAGVQDMDRWVSMATYTGSLPSYLSGLAQGIKSSGSKFGVGLCPLCQILSEADTEARFAALAKYNGTVREIDLWAAEYSVPPSVHWEYYWPRLAKWLAEA